MELEKHEEEPKERSQEARCLSGTTVAGARLLVINVCFFDRFISEGVGALRIAHSAGLPPAIFICLGEKSHGQIVV